jgi:hypothetical protein
MKKVKLLFTAFAVIAIVGGVLAANHKNSAVYYSCDTEKCTIINQISNINELQPTEDAAHRNIIHGATTTLNAPCSSSNCGTLYYGDGD